ncbi:uncharacterized protein JCM6883_001150 [Sporobolomyces salmoneus]|uniref:uncharacterized protein n=1 Tax=Sporobolomyces salmoneus TaxID=183962 RepID=UPI00317578BA
MLSSVLNRLHLNPNPPSFSSISVSSPDPVFDSDQPLPHLELPQSSETMAETHQTNKEEEETQSLSSEKTSSPSLVLHPPSSAFSEHYTSPSGVTQLFPPRQMAPVPVGGGGTESSHQTSHKLEDTDLSPKFSIAHRSSTAGVGGGKEEGKGLEFGYEKVENEVVAEFG